MSNENKEKILIYSAIIVIICGFLAVIVAIWSPLFKNKKYSSLNTYDSTITYENMRKNFYKQFLEKYLKIDNYDKLYNYISSDYIESLGNYSKEQLRNYLLSNGLISTSITVNDITYSNIDDNESMFRISYTSNLGSRYVNVYEDKPLNFKLSFEQEDLSSISSKKNMKFVNDNVKYTFEVQEANDTSIRYKLNIENNSESTYEYDFSALNSVQVISNSNYVNIASIANSSSLDYIITPGSSKSIELFYNLAFENQMNITGFLIRNVKVNGVTQNIKLEV